MSEREVLERARQAALSVVVPDGRYEDLLRRRDRKRRNQRITAGVVGIAVFVVAVWILTSGLPFHHTPTPVAPGASPVIQPSPPVSAVGPVPATDYLLDLTTGEMTPLPKSIGSEGQNEYAASPDGSRIAYDERADDGERAIFVANLDGTQIVQVTQGLEAAFSPAWSPDGSKIAYIGYHDGDLRDLFVLDLATGVSTQLTFATLEPDPAAPDWSPWRASLPSFTPDGSSILYGSSRGDEGGDNGESEVRMVPVAGGESVRLMGGRFHGAHFPPDAVQLSPDGALLSYGCGWGAASICVANADGTDERLLVPLQGDALNGGDWSPDGTRIGYFAFHSNNVSIVDVATGQWNHVAEGYWPTWVDDHTLIIEMDHCYDAATGARVQGCGG